MLNLDDLIYNIYSGIIGICLVIIGFFLTRFSNRVDEIDKSQAAAKQESRDMIANMRNASDRQVLELRNELLSHYYTKAEASEAKREMLETVKRMHEQIEKIYDKLDSIAVAVRK
jgi:predicted transcriptional regulator